MITVIRSDFVEMQGNLPVHTFVFEFDNSSYLPVTTYQMGVTTYLIGDGSIAINTVTDIKYIYNDGTWSKTYEDIDIPDGVDNITENGNYSVPNNATMGVRNINVRVRGGGGTADIPDAGSATNPVYFKNGVAVPTAYTLNKSVPANAVFTDTTYENKTASEGGTEKSLVTTGDKYNWNSKQNALTTTQLNAVNSGIDSSKVEQIGTNTAAIAEKVDKVSGKGLSTNDFTDDYINQINKSALQIEAIATDGVAPIDTTELGWANGKYAFSTGAFSSASNRVSSTVKLQVRVGTILRIKVAEGYDANYIGWETDATVPTHYSSTWPEGNEIVVKTKCPLYCFMIRKEDNGEHSDHSEMPE